MAFPWGGLRCHGLYLYGRAQEKISVEQSIMEASLKLHATTDWQEWAKKIIETMLRFSWATQIGCWHQNKQYYERSISGQDDLLASCLTTDGGFDLFSLNKKMEFFTVMKEPADSYALQMGFRSKPWLKRSDLDFLKEKK